MAFSPNCRKLSWEMRIYIQIENTTIHTMITGEIKTRIDQIWDTRVFFGQGLFGQGLWAVRAWSAHFLVIV